RSRALPPLSLLRLCLSRVFLPTHLPSPQFCYLRFSRLSPLRYCAGSDSCVARLHDAGLSAYSDLLSEHPALNHVLPPECRFIRHFSAFGFVSGLRQPFAGSPRHSAETGSLSYGLLFRLQLLSTPPRGDAVTFSFVSCDLLRIGLSPN